MGQALSLQEWTAARERIGSEAAMAELIDASMAAITAVLRRGHPCQCSFSGGKDSSLVASLTLVAAARLAAEGHTVPPIHILSVDTGIETPEVVWLRSSALEKMQLFASERGLPVTTAVVRPRLSEMWWPRLIGGRKLPTYPGAQSECSTDLKAKPATRYVTSLERKLKADGYPAAVTLLGTRFKESATRGAAMRERGESALEPVEVKSSSGGARLMLSPIAHWLDEQVFCYLQNVGHGRNYPSYADSFSETLRLYSDSAGGGCIIDVDPSQKSRGKGCGARHGCHQCQRVADDHSMKSLLLLPEYEYLRGLSALRSYISAIRWDFSKRNWINRVVDPETGDVRVFPNNFSPAECKRLLRMVLTLDFREQRRAEAVCRQLESGQIEDTPWNRRMSQPQFLNLDARQLVAIDHHWSQSNFAPPFEAWRIYEDVRNGQEMDVPAIEAVPRPEKMPPVRWLRGRPDLYAKTLGSLDAVREIAGTDNCPPADDDGSGFDVDVEGAAMFYGFELERMLEETAGAEHWQAHMASQYYLRMGIVTVPSGQRHYLDRAFRQGQYLILMGLQDQFEVDQVLATRLVREEARPPQPASAEQLALW